MSWISDLSLTMAPTKCHASHFCANSQAVPIIDSNLAKGTTKIVSENSVETKAALGLIRDQFYRAITLPIADLRK